MQDMWKCVFSLEERQNGNKIITRHCHQTTSPELAVFYAIKAVACHPMEIFADCVAMSEVDDLNVGDSEEETDINLAIKTFFEAAKSLQEEYERWRSQ